jgi:hypothetical protein
MKRSTAGELAKQLGLSRATVFNLKKSFPDAAPKTFDDVEEWRQFCLETLASSEATTRLLVKAVSGPSR